MFAIIFNSICSCSFRKANSVILYQDKMTHFAVHLEDATKANEYYRHVIHTSKHQQLVLMAVTGEIEMEKHQNDQFIKVELGSVEVTVSDRNYILLAGDSISITAGEMHRVVNTHNTATKLYTVYSPPHFKQGLIVEKDPSVKCGKL